MRVCLQTCTYACVTQLDGCSAVAEHLWDAAYLHRQTLWLVGGAALAGLLVHAFLDTLMRFVVDERMRGANRGTQMKMDEMEDDSEWERGGIRRMDAELETPGR